MFGSIILFLLLSHSWASHVTWLYPVDDSQVFNVRDTVWLTWESNTVETSMNMWCFNVKSQYWEPPLNNGRPWNVPSSGSYNLTFDNMSSRFKGGCHIGFYNQSAAHEKAGSIGNSATFTVSFDHQAYSHVWGKSEKLQNPDQTEPGHATAKNDTVPADAPAPPKGSSAVKQGSGGLRTAAQAGIGVAAAVAIIAVVVSIYVFWRLRRRRLARPHSKAHELPTDSETAHMPPSGENTLVPPSLNQSRQNSPYHIEKQQLQIHEAAGSTRFLPSELDGTARSELSS